MDIVMNHNSFDPIEYVKKLRNVGVSQEVAEIQAQALLCVIQDIISKSHAEFKKNNLTAINRDIED